jgi:hypothetical protein
MVIRKRYEIELTKDERKILRELGYKVGAKRKLVMSQAKYDKFFSDIKEAYRVYSDEETWKTIVVRKLYVALTELD